MSDINPISENASGVVPVIPAEVPPDAPMPVTPPSPLAVRLWCGFAFFIAASILGVGLWLHPEVKGFGTHQQMHMPPCGMLAVTGYPCPTCGCTTAVSYFAHGQVVQSFITQPFGAVVGVLCAITVLLGFFGTVTGRWIGPSMFWLGWYWRSILAASGGILLVGWVYKIIMIRAGY